MSFLFHQVSAPCSTVTAIAIEVLAVDLDIS